MSSPLFQRHMKPLFVYGPATGLRLFILCAASIILMTLDHRLHLLGEVRAGLSLAVYPLQYIVDLTARAGNWAGENLSSRNALLDQNTGLREQNLLLKGRLQKFAALETENKRLRDLLQSSLQIRERLLVAELLQVDMDPFRHQILLNKGSRDGVKAGQPLLDADGVMGQVLHAGPLTSTAVLITDPSHALPVQINRNGLRALAVGTGSFNRLDIPYITKNADVRVGDLLVTSGLGGRFPPSYPVATIVAVENQPGLSFARVSAVPAAHIERSREVLLVVTEAAPPKVAVTPPPVPTAPVVAPPAPVNPAPPAAEISPPPESEGPIE
ncbi:MAG: rod shape-determining protein MreC [Gammaproteobacteria bacterium]|nr:rod shape-determining protein MreC [Gammaproteobacteria bacterium]